MIGKRLRFFVVAVLGVLAVASGSRAEESAPKFRTIRNIVYCQRENCPLMADIYQPNGPGPFPGVLCIHGGAWAAGNKSNSARIAKLLADAGYTAVSIDYRLAPTYRFPAQIEDVEAALVWMRRHRKKYNIDGQRLGAWGYSAGGHLALLAAVRQQGLTAIVAGGAPADLRLLPLDATILRYWLGGTRRQFPKQYELASPAAFVSKDDPPVFLYHGEKDTLVPVIQAQKMEALLKRTGVPVELHTVPEAAHVGARLDPDALSRGIAFLDGHLKVNGQRPSLNAQGSTQFKWLNAQAIQRRGLGD